MCLYPELIRNRRYLPNKKNGALGYSVTITSLVVGSSTDNTADDKMYDIIGE